MKILIAILLIVIFVFLFIFSYLLNKKTPTRRMQRIRKAMPNMPN